MMSHILDRPIWSALETAHASLAEGNALARRYPPSIVPFAASADNSPESLEALARLPLGEEVMAIVEAERTKWHAEQDCLASLRAKGVIR